MLCLFKSFYHQLISEQVASFGGHLLDYDVLTMSVAPRDIHEAQVQFALERGVPAMLGVLSSFRLPYPSRSFDMGHCARCLIKWSGFGIYNTSTFRKKIRSLKGKVLVYQRDRNQILFTSLYPIFKFY